MNVKYPNITVKLVGGDGNAYAILGKVRAAMRKAGVPADEIKVYLDEAMGGDYNNLLATTMKYVEVA